MLNIDVYAFDGDGYGNLPHRIGGISFHLHDIISVNHYQFILVYCNSQVRAVSSSYDLWDDYAIVGSVELEITFNYGLFGYGCSNQLSEEKLKAEDMIVYSLIPRIIPSGEQRESSGAVKTVKRIPHPEFIPFRAHVHLKHAKNYGQSKFNKICANIIRRISGCNI